MPQNPAPDPTGEKSPEASEHNPTQLEEIQQFFQQHHGDCFWSWNPNTKVTKRNAARVLLKIRTHGGADGRRLLLRLLGHPEPELKRATRNPAILFFPLSPDQNLGYKLSHADTATNKILAAAGRMESRDYVDCLFLDQTYCSLGALVWAAAAKDSGLSPDLILELMQRNSRHSKEELETEVDWVVPFDPERMKERWLNACEEARKLIAWLPQEDYGCLYLNKASKVVTPTPETIDKLVRHHASKGGAWPKMDRIAKLEKPDGKDDPPR
jgi:hypothetical protein